MKKALAAFHLDMLAEEGLLEFEFKRLTGRTGPGAGRPAKLYRRSEREVELSLPKREYDLAGALLAGAIDASESSGRTVREELERASYLFGRTMGERAKERIDAGSRGRARRLAWSNQARKARASRSFRNPRKAAMPIDASRGHA